MNLINELQISAEQDDVLTVLRKTRRLASKLGRQDMNAWLDSEQRGYTPDDPLPTYRLLKGTLAYNTNGYIPAGYGYLKQGAEDLPPVGIDFPVPIHDPISGVLSMIESLNSRGPDRNSAIYLPLNEGDDFTESIRALYRIDPTVARQITLLMRLNSSIYSLSSAGRCENLQRVSAATASDRNRRAAAKSAWAGAGCRLSSGRDDFSPRRS